MKTIGDLFSSYKIPEEPKKKLRGQRDELVDHFTEEINAERRGTKYKAITSKEVALRINANPHFKGRDGEVFLLLKECREKGTFKKFFWCCPRPNAKKK